MSSNGVILRQQWASWYLTDGAHLRRSPYSKTNEVLFDILIFVSIIRLQHWLMITDFRKLLLQLASWLCLHFACSSWKMRYFTWGLRISWGYLMLLCVLFIVMSVFVWITILLVTKWITGFDRRRNQRRKWQHRFGYMLSMLSFHTLSCKNQLYTCRMVTFI